MKTILLISIFLLQLSCSSQTSVEQIQISRPSIEQESSSIWRTINDIQFLEAQGYQISLPDNDLIQSLVTSSKNQNFGNDDFPKIYNLLESNIYKEDDYDKAFQKTSKQAELLNQLILQLREHKANWNWDFKMFETYKVVFTLYGTGGSYDPDLGLVTLFTNQKGAFKNYKQPANTIIHEIVHMGIEESIVQKYQLPHSTKERIVDLITYTLFKDMLPEYKLQDMGDTKVDDFIKSNRDLKDLNSLIEQYLASK